ncbi:MULTISPECIES: ATP-grasp peptide maturase system methyltransferase [Streptomyces]|uniref:ATP-grasp peptide maturase system methyltransferase n=2 Tax=Streptomyces TaxID=1883 RepID=UPI0004CD67AE|nr:MULTISPECIES: ATP-grasp peptide maturase system methyltransferase [Streptomyces]MYX82749.1 methyltransferase [Streptomyces sp. SID4915]MBT2886364.1 methyltransferase [Streptomyces sp. McG5]MBT2891965.1 methyltransferase [Streptomyces sp. McG2]MEE1721909.1 ATP-grasp peptide maturase system methyltransferase [Streptomyces sp. JV186]RZE77722.1 methyltransferase [Streptomyces albidoflavus]
MTDPTTTTAERRALAARLAQSGALRAPAWRQAVESVPREAFLHPGVFLPEPRGRWRPVLAGRTPEAEWARLAYSDQSLVTQLDGSLTPDQATTPEPVPGVPTSSSTEPALVLRMLESLEVAEGMRVLEIGTGTGYSSALLCHRLGEDAVTTVEVDPGVARRADDALEGIGVSTWTVTGDGLLGHPARAPYDRVIAACAVRRVPYAWVRQTRPGGVILSTLGSWAHGAGLAKVSVGADGTAEGRIVGPASFMQARAQAQPPVTGDLAARAAYADSEREVRVPPTVLEEWTPAFLAQLTVPDAQLVHARTAEGEQQRTYLFDPGRESFAEFVPGPRNAAGWTVRQGGPVRLWDQVEEVLLAWRDAGSPGVDAVRLRVTETAHHYWLDGTSAPSLRWEHALR